MHFYENKYPVTDSCVTST